MAVICSTYWTNSKVKNFHCSLSPYSSWSVEVLEVQIVSMLVLRVPPPFQMPKQTIIFPQGFCSFSLFLFNILNSKAVTLSLPEIRPAEQHKEGMCRAIYEHLGRWCIPWSWTKIDTSLTDFLLELVVVLITLYVNAGHNN